jgi:methionyl-tRNA formyltransferase
VTNPDRPAGRGLKLTPSPIKETATRLGLEVIQDKARSPELKARLEELAPDVAVVVAYGSILPVTLLDVSAKGFVNVHFSLLPSYRGAAPVQRAIMDGAEASGASIMILTEGMDEGPVLATSRLPIDDADTAGTYGAKLADIGADTLVTVLPLYLDGRARPIPQDDRHATYADKIGTEDAHIDWRRSATEIRNLVRALHPRPGAWTTMEGNRLKVWRVEKVDGPALAPGALSTRDGLVVGTGDGVLSLAELQPATKRPMTGAEFARGLRGLEGRRLGT